jgi:hypothetical protein
VLALAIVMGAWPLGGAANSVDDVVRAVRDGNRRELGDEPLAKELRKISLDLRLDNRTTEELESEAPGPKSIAELERLRELTRDLPLPAVLPWFASPPIPTMDELREVLSAARRKTIAYTDNLPDFLCTEMVRRYQVAAGRGSSPLGNWALEDTLTVQLTYFDHHEEYKLTAMNGRKTMRTYEEVGGAFSRGEFGSMTYFVFAAASQAAFKWSNWTTLRKRPTYVLSYQIDIRNSHYRLVAGQSGRGSDAATVGEHGLVYIDRETKDVMRVEGEADTIPNDFLLRAASRSLDYGPDEVGGRTYLLPLRAVVRMTPRFSPRRVRNEVEFTAYRKFTGESTISFGDGSAPASPTVKK